MLIRTAKSDDAEAVDRIRVNAWRAAYQEFLPADYLAALDTKSNLDSLSSVLASPESPFCLKVAEQNGIVAGFSIVGLPRHEADSGTYELWALNVEPSYFRKGIGQALVEEALRYSKSRDAIKMELWCVKGNTPAGLLYESCGFTLTGTERVTSRLTGHPLAEVLFQICL